MTSNGRRALRLGFLGLLLSSVWLANSATAQTVVDTSGTPNVLMGIDGMVINHAGLFRSNPDGADGFNTFVFNIAATGVNSTLGRYKSFHLVNNSAAGGTPQGGGISHNGRINSNTPETFLNTEYVIGAPLDLSNDYFPVVDRTVFGQLFDPAEYEIEVQFKPNLAGGPLPVVNTSATFGVSLDNMDGYVWDEEDGSYKRAGEQIGYTIGSEEEPINDWYTTAPKDADGFATWTVPVTNPTFVQKSFYYDFGADAFRTDNVLPGGGRTFNTETSEWEDVTDGPDFNVFGGGPEDPSRPGSRLDVPNGLNVLGLGSAFEGPDLDRILSVEIKSVALKRINPGAVVARLDSNSGLTFRFGTSLGYDMNNPAPGTRPEDSAINVNGFNFSPVATDQISRFDENGMTNLTFNPREPLNDEGYRFFLRQAPGIQTFDGTEATVHVRAKLTEPVGSGNAETLQIVAKELDGSDDANDPLGADEYTFDLDLSQFNTTDFTTVAIPLSDFALNTLPFGFTNEGDGLLTDFDLYEFGGLVAAGGGLLKLELEYMEIRLPETGLAGDFDGDNDVDGADFLGLQRENPSGIPEWSANYPQPSPLATSTAVPEPTSVALMLCAAALFVGRRHA